MPWIFDIIFGDENSVALHSNIWKTHIMQIFKTILVLMGVTKCILNKTQTVFIFLGNFLTSNPNHISSQAMHYTCTTRRPSER